MNQLLFYREKQNLTQQQLSEKSNISVRTIQRIEAGQTPKGHTLEVLSQTLAVSKEELLNEPIELPKNNISLIKWINLSSLLLLIVPLGSIALPLVIMYWKKEVNKITKQIVSIQILWTFLYPVVVLVMIFLGKWLSLSNQVVPFTMLALLLLNIYIIIRNTAELDKNQKLHIKLNFNIL